MKGMLTWSALLFAMTVSATAGDYSTWLGYRRIHLKTTGITTAPVTKYPVLVRFTAAEMFTGGAASMANGADLRFTKADGTTDLPFQIDSWTTGAGGSGAVWVLLDSVPANKDTAYTFRVYWGKAGSTTLSNPSATFAPANGNQAVFHLGKAAGNDTDAARGYAGVVTGTSSTTGLIGNALTFNTSTSGAADEEAAADYLTFSPGATDPLSTLAGPITMEAWVFSSITNNGNTSTGTKQILSHGTGTAEAAWMTRSASNPNTYAAGGATAITGPEVPFGEATDWAYIVAVYNGTNWTLYRQRNSDPWGVPTITGGSTTPKTVTAGTGPTASANPWFIGAWSSTGTAAGNKSRPWKGQIDEVRVSNVARDSNYIRLNFETQKAAGSPITFGTGVVGIRPSASSQGLQGYGIRASGSSIIFNLPADVPGARVSVRDLGGRIVWSRTVAAGQREVSWTASLSGVFMARTELGNADVAAEVKLILP
jgi:hypothetical protein